MIGPEAASHILMNLRPVSLVPVENKERSPYLMTASRASGHSTRTWSAKEQLGTSQ
jgi:hypothetical protein